MNFTTASEEVARAHEIVLALTSRVYTDIETVEEGTAVKQLIHAMGIRSLVWSYNKIATVLDNDPIVAANYVVTGFPSNLKSHKEKLDQLLVVQGWLLDPYFYDSRPTYRDAALMNLTKAQEIILDVIDRICQPR